MRDHSKFINCPFCYRDIYFAWKNSSYVGKCVCSCFFESYSYSYKSGNTTSFYLEIDAENGFEIKYITNCASVLIDSCEGEYVVKAWRYSEVNYTFKSSIYGDYPDWGKNLLGAYEYACRVAHLKVFS